MQQKGSPPAAAEAASPPTSLPHHKSLSKTSSASSENFDDRNAEKHGHQELEGVQTSNGVRRMEAVAKASTHRPALVWIIRICVLVTAWAYSLQSSTTYAYEPLATSSFGQHSSGLAALSIASSIISAVSKPFIAKLADITSRPYVFILVISLYTLGFILVASSPSLAAYVIGDVFITIGYSGLDLLSDIIVADLITLQWRGFASSMLSAPFIINVWFAGLIADALQHGEKWRWGYGMFAIIAPVVMTPCIITLIYLERKAVRGEVSLASSKEVRRHAKAVDEVNRGEKSAADLQPLLDEPWALKLKRGLREIDAFGLLLLGFGWSLLLLPFSLKSYADHGYSNRSLIAMFCVGGFCLLSYILYEVKWAPFPTAPKRLLTNKTFILAVVIDSVYTLAGSIRSLYLSSYVYVVKDWSVRDWTYWGNTLTLSLCVFALFAGLVFRLTHRYKMMQIIGLGIKIVGLGLLVDKSGVRDTARLVMSPLLIGCGGAFSVVASRVASQASVPHQHTALVISLLSLWSKIGTSIGSAVAASVWSDMMPKQLRAQLPASVSDDQVTKFFGNIRAIRAYDINSDIRQGAIKAYENTVWHLWPAALGISFIPLICACFQTNFYLGTQQNAYDNKGLTGEALPDDENGRIVRAKEEERQNTSRWVFWRR